MPTESSYPNNIQSSNVILSRSGTKWKAYSTIPDSAVTNECGIKAPSVGNFIYPKRYNVVGMVRPFFNKQNGSSYQNGTNSTTLAYPGTGAPYGDYTITGDANKFRARPIKQWRLQYGDINKKQILTNSHSISQLSMPGGTIVTDEKTYNSNRCQPIYGIVSYEVGKFSKIGIYNPYLKYKHDNDTMKTYSKVGDPESKAKRLVRYTSRIDAPWIDCKKPYYVNYKYYLQSRSKTYEQNKFQFRKFNDTQDESKINPRTCRSSCGRSAYESITYRSNCSSLQSVNCSNSLDISACSGVCSYNYYKPNNCHFSQQGAVSGSSRLLRLKKNTIDKNARSIGKIYGSNALAYSSMSQTPFINKSKMNSGGYTRTRRGIKLKYPCDNSLYHIYRHGGGNLVTTAMNSSSNNKIIRHRCVTSEWPRKTYRDDSKDKGIIFIN